MIFCEMGILSNLFGAEKTMRRAPVPLCARGSMEICACGREFTNQ